LQHERGSSVPILCHAYNALGKQQYPNLLADINAAHVA
jgi:hypothetical protein